jgi:succinyl-diaminopimelate desuccinylase
VSPPEALLARTLALVDIPSPSREEGPILDHVRAEMARLPLRLDTGSALLYGPRDARVVLAGHVDTVPAQGNLPGARRGDGIHGLGASDMKGGLAVMLELARARADLGFLFFAREELPVAESALPEVLDVAPTVRDAELVVMLEPTANALEVGCLGNISARVRFTGVSAHSARPWLGVNAIARAVEALGPLAAVPPRPVRMGEAEWVEVLSLVGIGGGVARNVIPGEAWADLNFRYAPDRTPGEAEARLAELVGETGELEVESNAPPARAPVGNPHVERLRAAGAAPVRAKQAWTPVAEFAARGIPAVNLGPGDPAQAHTVGERVDGAALARCYGILSAL